jgi:hypothetical protein
MRDWIVALLLAAFSVAQLTRSAVAWPTKDAKSSHLIADQYIASWQPEFRSAAQRYG